MTVRLRPARPEDAAAVRDLVRASYAIYVERMDREPAPMLADYAELISRNVVTVAETDGRIGGILVCYPRGDALHVENVAVAPEFQGRAIGRLLMGHAEKLAQLRKLHKIEFYTNEVMTENLPFYKALGYHICGRAIQDGYARIFFEKDLAAGPSG